MAYCIALIQERTGEEAHRLEIQPHLLQAVDTGNYFLESSLPCFKMGWVIIAICNEDTVTCGQGLANVSHGKCIALQPLPSNFYL